ncbi:MAG: hypothetical protein L0387_19660 [Acidobacteria bacterium]|nr:hypothetical protein [Acidobacteriota bacterium]MCI0721818.1 hypothetical protein [Acidobacteriota bacterium]
MRRKRKTKKPNVTTTNLDFAAAKFGEAREIVREGVERSVPHKRRLKDLAEGADAGLAVMERLARGEITVEQSLKEFEILGARWPFLKLNPPPPALPPQFASELLKLVRSAQEKRPQAPQELQEWLRRTFAKPRGRPTDANLTPVYRAAARLRRRGWSWMRITRKLCPLRNAEGHQCAKSCVDKIRMGVKEYQA